MRRAAPCCNVPVTFTLDLTCERLMGFNRSERAILRELASEVYEAEARTVLADLDASFREWRKKQRLSSDLLADIHAFHQRDSRDLWARYQGLDDATVVARGVAFGFIPKKKVPREILQKLNLEVWKRMGQEGDE
ncbi:hypothetical protein H8N03_25800 [Ramlibacter sp. USB13]|uniref:Uncharacterized protein n=2 Tax=Ramlibacter cellulosilyticus TaxID=2764187 RepID=A0A923MX98_9BURK|nr:hypothetical protein [Ramlibacter cellulosilyticus]